MNLPEVITVDFETAAIAQRPAYPPEPVGVAIKHPGALTKYISWGHPSGNTGSFDQALEALDSVWRSSRPILFHHTKFDLAVAYEKMGLPKLPWQRVHDTMFLAFLADPHATKLSLKELATDLLEMPTDEQDAVHSWIMARKDDLPLIDGKRPSKSTAGAWISYVPGDLVASYAIGDVERAYGLFKHLWPLVQREGMGAAYDRERRLLPILMENERVGMRVDTATLERDVERYAIMEDATERWLRDTLQASDLNFDADQDVANVLLQRGAVLEDSWTRTAATKSHPNGQLSVAKDVLRPEHFTDPRIASALGYRNRLKTCLTMFMEPWLAQASVNKSYVTTNWNQTRGYEGGARSGRPSTNNHNFLNLSKDFEGRDDGYTHPAFLGVAPLPLVRRYVLPDEGHVFLHRDFDGQEMRVFAHSECGELKRQYAANPKLDPHGFVGMELERVTTRKIERTKVKALNFQGLYGGGVPALQRKLRISYSEAKELKAFHDRALPGRKLVVDAIKALVNLGEPIRTWGGRVYYCEPSKVIDGRMRSMDYKLINYYCQGSAADITKEALCCWHEAGHKARFLVTVYDEINVSAPLGCVDEEMELLRVAMELPRLDIMMLTTGKRGPNWGALEKCA